MLEHPDLELLRADVVVVGIGVVPATAWLDDSGLTLHDGVVCTPTLQATRDGAPVPGVYAAGDLLRWPHPLYDSDIRIEHWTNAAEQGAAAAPAFDVDAPVLAVMEALRAQEAVLVTEAGAPVVYEANPTYFNLFGRIEHIVQMGNATTNFNMIKAGALHRANGGYLILDTRRVLSRPFVWEALKQALFAKQVQIETPAESYGWVSTTTLKPEPIPLDARIILIGERWLYYLLCHYDIEFSLRQCQRLLKQHRQRSNTLGYKTGATRSYTPPAERVRTE